MQTFGDYLKRQREAIKFSLREVAHLTHITERYLYFIEKDDFAKIPEGPYVRGYISSYATAIVINAHETLDRFDSHCRERDNAKNREQEIWKDKIKQGPIAFFFNKSIWFLLCFIILLFLTFGVYHLFSQDQEKSHVVANLQVQKDKGLQATLPLRSEGNVSTLSLKDYAISSAKLEDLQKDMEHGDNEMAQVDPSPAREPNRQANEAPQPSVQPGRIPRPATPLLGVASAEQTGGARPDHENNTEVLEAVVCSDVKNRSPYGENNSFQWSTDRIYIWNLIKCRSVHASIRHIYYFKGRKVSDISLNIKSSPWRTWSFKTLLDQRYIGPWRVDITSADGGLLQRVYFEVY